MKIVEDIQLKIGCNWVLLSVIAFLLLLVLAPNFGAIAVVLFFTMLLSIFFGFVYYQHYAKARLTAYTNMIVKTAKSKLSDPNAKIFILTKKGKSCNRYLTTRKEYDINLLFLSHDCVTIMTKCPTFNLFNLKREDYKKKWAIKKSCGLNKEFYYPYIQSVHYNPDKKGIDIVLTSGEIETIIGEKSDAEKAIKALREILRNTERGVQTNRVHST